MVENLVFLPGPVQVVGCVDVAHDGDVRADFNDGFSVLIHQASRAYVTREVEDPREEA
jgi:hypothetical protein